LGVSIPQPFETSLSGSLGSVGPVTVAGIPDTFHIDVDKLPKIQMGLDPIEVKPLELSLKLQEVPSQRTHLPADFHVGLSIFGMDVLCVRLCGEAQMINEPYVPNPCEHCGGEHGNRRQAHAGDTAAAPRIG
jgi:hypothetical protein